MDTSSSYPTLHEARHEFTRWLQERGGPSDHTVRAYVSDVSAMVRAFHRDMVVTDIDSDRIRSFFELQQRSGLEATTLRRRAAGVRSFCVFLVDRRFLEQSPWPPEGFRFQRTRRLPRVLSTGDLKTLLRHLMYEADVDHRVPSDVPLANPVAGTLLLATALMLTTGLRVGELVSFRTSDLSLSNLSVQVLGKGRRERIVYLTDEWLVRLVQAYGVTREHLGVHQEQFLFNSRLGPVSTASIRTRLAAAGETAGVEYRVTPHMLRHSAATQLIEAGVNIRFVQRLLGHASLTTTEIYTHVRDQALQHAILSAGVLAQHMSRSD